MFKVRTSPRPAPTICSCSPLPGTLLRRPTAVNRRLPPSGPPRTVREPCLRPSAERDGLQPAPELGHLARHGHALHVCRALLPALCPRYLQSQPSRRHAACAHRARSPPLPPPPARSPPPYRVPCLRPSAASVRLQPAPGVGHLQRQEHELGVCRALLPAPRAPQSVVAALPPARWVQAALACRLPPPGPQPAPHRVPCLRPSAVRAGLQPATELGHLARHGHALHVFRALLPAPCPPNLQSLALSPAC